MEEVSFVDVEKIDKTLVLDIRYATANNFTGKVLYPSPQCFLRRAVALKLLPIQQKLRKQGLGLKIFDGYRPMSVQKKLWDFFPNPKFVADPKKGSKHSRGVAIDLTLVDLKGNELPMPTPFDDFTERACRDCIDLPKEVVKNRELLANAMQEEGFIPLPSEWWHFDDENWERYPLEDLSFEKLEQTCDV